MASCWSLRRAQRRAVVGRPSGSELRQGSDQRMVGERRWQAAAREKRGFPRVAYGADLGRRVRAAAGRRTRAATMRGDRCGGRGRRPAHWQRAASGWRDAMGRSDGGRVARRRLGSAGRSHSGRRGGGRWQGGPPAQAASTAAAASQVAMAPHILSGDDLHWCLFFLFLYCSSTL